MAVFGTNDAQVLMPRNIADGMIIEARTGSTVAQLSGSEPQRFGEVDYIIFNDFPKAEFVGEGADKASTTGGYDDVTAKPHKAQVTLRFNEEVQWADEDYQLGILSSLGNAGALALSRALDLGLYHRINPLTGTAITGWDNYLNATTNRVALNADSSLADMDVEESVGILLGNSKAVNGIADPDGQGDLKRKNQIALRLEIVFGWYVFEDRFVALDKAGTVEP
jgi:hypothetical protein